jgi:hypothetical protein
VNEKLEEGSALLAENGDNQTHALVSIAFSLKRIADAMQTSNEYGEVGSAALAGAISRSLRGT